MFKSIMSVVGGYLGVCFIMCHFRLFSGVPLSLPRCSSVSFVWSAVCLQFVMHLVQRWRLSLGTSQPYLSPHGISTSSSDSAVASSVHIRTHRLLPHGSRSTVAPEFGNIAALPCPHGISASSSDSAVASSVHVYIPRGFRVRDCRSHTLSSWASAPSRILVSLSSYICLLLADCVDCTLVVYCIYIVRCRCFTSSLFVYLYFVQGVL